MEMNKSVRPRKRDWTPEETEALIRYVEALDTADLPEREVAHAALYAGAYGLAELTRPGCCISIEPWCGDENCVSPDHQEVHYHECGSMHSPLRLTTDPEDFRTAKPCTVTLVDKWDLDWLSQWEWFYLDGQVVRFECGLPVYMDEEVLARKAMSRPLASSQTGGSPDNG